jgi:NAD(P)-dependent dehydrogenase (short-subunit alcohol dehydrogenase family)
VAGLVNNAGVGSVGPMEYFPLEDVRWMFDVNYFGAIATTQAFLPLLKKKRGRIVLMSSIAGRFAVPFNGPYSSTKFALEAFGDALRTELKPWGVRVTSIEPGLVDTPIIGDKLAWFWGSWDVAETPPEIAADYAEALEAMVATTDKLATSAIAVDGVSMAVRKALTSRRPKTRQTVGRDAWFTNNVLRRLPDRWGDVVMRRFAGLPD